MTKEIQNLIDHPETIREALNIDELDKLIKNVINVFDSSIEMKYSVQKIGNEIMFKAESKQDFVHETGIFSNVFKECKIDSYCSYIVYTDDGGFRVWFTLELVCSGFNGVLSGLSIATFVLDGGKWMVEWCAKMKKNHYLKSTDALLKKKRHQERMERCSVCWAYGMAWAFAAALVFWGLIIVIEILDHHL